MDCRPTIDIKSASTPLFGVLAAVAAELVRGPWELLESCKPGVDTRSGWLAEAEIFFSVLLLAAAASGDDENKATVAAAAAGEVEGSSFLSDIWLWCRRSPGVKTNVGGGPFIIVCF